MIESSLHTANICHAIATLATAADLTLSGGEGSLIGGALSGHALLKGLPRRQRQIARDMARALEDSHLQGARKAAVARLLAEYYPTQRDLVAADMDPAQVSERLAACIEEDAAGDGFAIIDFKAMLTALLRPHLTAADLHDEILHELLRRTSSGGHDDRLRDNGITEEALIRLAQRISADVEDVGKAWLELQNAMDIAVRLQAEAAQGTNHTDFVETVLVRTAEMTAQGEFHAATDAIEDALRQEEEEHKARKLKLYERGIDTARLAGDAPRMAKLLVARSDLEADEVRDAIGLRQLVYDHRTLGKNHGIRLAVLVAMELCYLALARARTPREQGIITDDLASCVADLGEYERSSEALLEAADLYRRAMELRTQEDDPFGWGLSKNNLGTVYRELADRTGRTDYLTQAQACFRAALEVHPRDTHPEYWANATNNLGTVLLDIGKLTDDVPLLEEALGLLQDCLPFRPQDIHPISWANTYNGIGNALLYIGDRTKDPQILKRAAEAYETSLKERTRQALPLGWAMSSQNLGRALWSRGLLTGEIDLLRRSVEINEAVRAHFDRLQLPIQWAGAQAAYATALKFLALADPTDEVFARAKAGYADALLEWERERFPSDWAFTQLELAGLYIAWFDRLGGPERLRAAQDHVLLAQREYQAGHAQRFLELCDQQLSVIDALAKESGITL